MAKVLIYTKDHCPYCTLAKDLFTAHHVNFEEIRVDLDEKKLAEMIQLTQKRTVPQIFINTHLIGGYDELAQLVKNGKLADLLKN